MKALQRCPAVCWQDTQLEKELQRNMKQFIGCDAHKKFSVFVSLDEKGEFGRGEKIGHDRELFRHYLAGLPAGSDIALETSGSYYWIVDEMEQAGHHPHLAHARTAKRRMEGRHKTDERDARGLAMLLQNGTLPKVWIPSRELRDQREMLRWRMTLSNMRTRLKNRIHGVLLRYNLQSEYSDLFGDGGRADLLERLGDLPCYSKSSVVYQLQMVDSVESQLVESEAEIERMLYPSVERSLLDSLPCVGKILSAVLTLEIGDIRRFASGEHLASYAGLVECNRESADRKQKVGCPPDCNVYLKWAYVEAANLISVHRKKWPERHVAQLYERVKRSAKYHGKAAVAVGRHLAEASFAMLTRQQVYQDPKQNRKALSSTLG